MFGIPTTVCVRLLGLQASDHVFPLLINLIDAASAWITYYSKGAHQCPSFFPSISSRQLLCSGYSVIRIVDIKLKFSIALTKTASQMI